MHTRPRLLRLRQGPLQLNNSAEARLEGFEAGGSGIVTLMMENHMEETMENEMETGMICLKGERKNVLKRAQEVWCQDQSHDLQSRRREEL